MSYAVISPVKNEAEFIELTIESMIQQTIKPGVWVIVNDGSQDKTESIVRKYAEENDWIKLVNRQGSTVRKRGKGVVEAFYAGFDSLDQEYDFIVKLDGDVTFAPNYFESLLQQFDLDPQLGIAGGGLYEKPDVKTWVLLTSKDHVRGCTKIYRQECFKAIGGLAPSMGWDGIDEWKALAMGWKIQSFLDIKIYHYRYTGAATGYLKSWIEQGNGAFRMGYHPLFLFARGIRCMTERPYVIGGLAMVASYILSWFRREEMLAEPFVVNYIRRTQMKKLIGLLSGKPVHE
ncbi:MAG: glycosyltransferase family 2 protein [Chloroflexi bacterium HGW-Chloroflexi-8]|nr:MAG: glycosyltransferase family 2 protein [Chloroflexi bacterium HGW-Chloroflexi-8]